jgi:peptide/nickel transport system permease protein
VRAYAIRRLLALVPTLLFASLIVFLTVRHTPGDVIDLIRYQADISADKRSRVQLKATLGLNTPMPSR